MAAGWKVGERVYKPGQTITIKRATDDYRKKKEGQKKQIIKQKWEVVKQYKYFVLCKRKLRNGSWITECFSKLETEEGMYSDI